MATSNTTTTTPNEDDDNLALMARLNYASNEKDYFDFYFDVTNDDVKRIHDLQNVTNLRNPRKFTINCHAEYSLEYDSRDFSVLGDLFCLFVYFKSNNIIWETFVLKYWCCDYMMHSCTFIGSLMSSANSMSFFKRFEFEASDGYDFDIETCVDIEGVMSQPFFLSGITQNENLESIEVMPTSALTDGDVDNLKKLLLTSKTLKELAFDEMPSRLDDLYQSIAENKTLEKLHLNFHEWNNFIPTNLSMTNMILSLKGHPTIRDLTVDDIRGTSELNLTAHAIGSLLAHPTTLSSLTLKQDDYFRSDRFVSRWKLEHIFQGLEESRSLKTLKVEYVLRSSLNRLLSFPNSSLETIYYRQEEVTSETWDSVTRMKRRMSPIVLVLQIVERQQQHYEKLKEMLHNHPELRLRLCYADPLYFPEETHTFSEITTTGAAGGTDPDLLHICNFNWHGRYLLDYARRNNKRVPLSLWSLVLGKANDKPSILYEFLKSDKFLESGLVLL